MKAALRDQARRARAGCDPALGMRLAGHVLARCPPPPGQVVAGFWPIGSEIDIRPLLLALAGRGHTLALPEADRRGEPLTFHRWRPGDALFAERFGTFRPAPHPIVPDLLLVPLLAFDRNGGRLGYGGGFYDRSLAELGRCRTLGCAFAAQEVAQVPVEPHDRRLDAVATEAGVIVVGNL